MKHFISLLIVLSIMLTGCAQKAKASDYDFANIPEYTMDDIERFKELKVESLQRMEAADQMVESAKILGYTSIISSALDDWNQAFADYIMYSEKLDSAKWVEAFNEYPAATCIWKALKEAGYNDYVAAGIMGNIMSEVGGQTLDLDYYAKNPKGYYGICQWNKQYKKDVWGASLEKQIEFLKESMKYELDTFGSCYKKNFKYKDFCSLVDTQQAAKAFAACYERCGSGSYTVRMKNALVAYDYFTQRVAE